MTFIIVSKSKPMISAAMSLTVITVASRWSVVPDITDGESSINDDGEYALILCCILRRIKLNVMLFLIG